MNESSRPSSLDDLKQLLRALNEHAAQNIDPNWFADGENIRVVDEFVVDILSNACGETYESLEPHVQIIDLEGIPVRTADLEGLLKTKQSPREKDSADRVVL